MKLLNGIDRTHLLSSFKINQLSLYLVVKYRTKLKAFSKEFAQLVFLIVKSQRFSKSIAFSVRLVQLN